MKNKLLLFFAVTVLAVLPNLSLAASTTPKETIKDKIESKKEEIKNNIEERKQNATNQIELRLNQFVGNVIERFNAATSRLDILVQRIDSRITKMEAQNIDTTKAKEILVVAKAKIETAKIDIALVTLNTNPSASSGQVASTTVSALKEAFGITKTQIAKAKQDLKDAHAALVDVVNSLKPGNNKLEN